MTQNIEKLREEIDKVDDGIINLLSKRKCLAKKIAEIKKEFDKPVLDGFREQQIIEKIKNKSKELGLDANLINSLYQLILENSKNEQQKIIKNKL